MYSTQKGTDMDLKRHGFKEKDNAAELPDDVNKYRNSQSQIGSKLEANMTFNINRNVSWTSRFYYFTDYHRITGEFENTFRSAGSFQPGSIFTFAMTMVLPKTKISTAIFRSTSC